METVKLNKTFPEILEYYEITKKGEVYHQKLGLIQQIIYNDSVYVNLMTTYNKPQQYKVDRLVLSTFKPKKDMNKISIIHKDKDFRNNNLDNLEWFLSKQPKEKKKYYIPPKEFQEYVLTHIDGNVDLPPAPANYKLPIEEEKIPLTDNDIKEIFELAAAGVTQAEIGRIFGRDRSTINRILYTKKPQ